jgi:hypothetical protein
MIRMATTFNVSRSVLYSVVAGFMSLAGTVFWTAGYAAGLHSGALLASLFAMGASSALLVIVLWLMSHAAPQDARARPGGGPR